MRFCATMIVILRMEEFVGKVKSQAELYGENNARIGVLGGTFDPPHFAHIHMANAAKTALKLDCVVFMPLGVAPHGKSGISTAEDRICMLELLMEDSDSYFIDDFETKMTEPSYTIKSAERIYSILGEGSKVYFIIGADSLMYLEKWREAQKLMKMTAFAVIPRAGYKKSECMAHIRMLEDEFGADITYIETESLGNSSTEIRTYLGDAQALTNKKVLKYIEKKNLYK